MNHVDYVMTHLMHLFGHDMIGLVTQELIKCAGLKSALSSMGIKGRKLSGLKRAVGQYLAQSY